MLWGKLGGEQETRTGWVSRVVRTLALILCAVVCATVYMSASLPNSYVNS